MTDFQDNRILDAFLATELAFPSPRKIIDGKPIYLSRRFDLPKNFGAAVLCGFGSAVCGDKPQVHDAQPDVYRCPEVLLRTEWSYPADIWNVGAMVSKLQLSSPEAETNRIHI
jgi:hypothetical protein